MHFLAAVLPLLGAFAPANSAPIESPFMGVIEAPTSNSPVSPTIAFPFSYSVTNWCEEGYNNFKVFLTQGTEPTINDVDSTGNIPIALYDFGEFTVANFGKNDKPVNRIPHLLTVMYRLAPKWHPTSNIARSPYWT